MSECLKDLNEKQLLSLRTQLNELRDVKSIDYQLISQIKIDKYLIEKVFTYFIFKIK